jgi:hypothetical protein
LPLQSYTEINFQNGPSGGTPLNSTNMNKLEDLLVAINNVFPSAFGVLTATASELNKLDGATVTTAEINKLAGLLPTTTELNYVDGVTSSIQTQLNAKARIIIGTYTGTGTYGSSNPNSFIFSVVPKIVFIGGYGGVALFVHDSSSSFPYSYSGTGVLSFVTTWNDSIPSMSWYTNSATSAWQQLNASGTTYTVVYIA